MRFPLQFHISACIAVFFVLDIGRVHLCLCFGTLPIRGTPRGPGLRISVPPQLFHGLQATQRLRHNAPAAPAALYNQHRAGLQCTLLQKCTKSRKLHYISKQLNLMLCFALVRFTAMFKTVQQCTELIVAVLVAVQLCGLAEAGALRSADEPRSCITYQELWDTEARGPPSPLAILRRIFFNVC